MKKDDGREAADLLRSVNNLKSLALAMHNFHDANGHFPPAAVYNRAGKPLLSWRVLLLPYLDEEKLFREFKLDEPWDSPHNKKLVSRMPAVFAAPRGKGKESRSTVYQVFNGPNTIFQGPRPGRIADITDGTANTILIVEAAEPVPWTKPADLPYAPKKPLPKVGGLFKKGFNAAFADGSVHFIKYNIDEKVMRLLITCNDGQVIPEIP
jgi:prepilin-type processing-associated H-X9-DG protein